MTQATVIADSKNEFGQRITTFIITFPRYLLAEFNTHRMLSRNSASSRAIRFEKMVQSVMENPFIPSRWQKDHPGMQGVEYFDEIDSKEFVRMWLSARDSAVGHAQILNHQKVTKQIANRLLEPFMYHTCLVTGTEWENFFALRAHEAAEIHFQDLAEKMLVAINESTPKQLKAGEWHIPFADDLVNIAEDAVRSTAYESMDKDDKLFEEFMIKIATVRCARISYVTPGSTSKMDYKADLELHDRLFSSGHWSAFEHCARAMNEEEYEYNTMHNHITDAHVNCSTQSLAQAQGWCGNFKGFIQYRKMFVSENRSDSRLIKK